MSESLSDDRNDETLDSSGRRGFLTKSGMMLALLALAQGGELAGAAETTKAGAVMRTGPVTLSETDAHSIGAVLDASIKAGKLDTSAPDYEKLSPEVRKSLATLNSDDLHVLAQAQSALARRFRPRRDGNNGIIGM